MTRFNILPKKHQKKSGSKKVYCPLEEKEQETIAQYLDIKKFCWIHVPNGGNRDVITGAKLKRQGVKAGFPDIQIFDAPISEGKKYRGLIIELKRREGGRLRENQKEWIEELRARNWLCYVAHGAMDGIEFIEGLEFEGVK